MRQRPSTWREGAFPGFDSVLLVSFGGPHGPADIRPFLQRVLRGRRVAPERVEEVAHHYELFGGVSPITELTQRQADGSARAARGGGPSAARVRRHAQLASAAGGYAARDARRRARGTRSGSSPPRITRYSSCQQYRENVAAARAELRQATRRRRRRDLRRQLVRSSAVHRGQRRARAGGALAAAARSSNVGAAGVHRAQHSGADGRGVALSSSSSQSRRGSSPMRPASTTGRSSIRAAADGRRIRGSSRTSATTCAASRQADSRPRSSARSASCAITSRCCTTSIARPPTCAARSACRWSRAEAVNDDPLFLDMMADVVLDTIAWYEGGRPLPIVPESG